MITIISLVWVILPVVLFSAGFVVGSGQKTNNSQSPIAQLLDDAKMLDAKVRGIGDSGIKVKIGPMEIHTNDRHVWVYYDNGLLQLSDREALRAKKIALQKVADDMSQKATKLLEAA